MTFLERMIAELKALRAEGIEGSLVDAIEIDGITYTVMVNEQEEDFDQ